MRETVSVGIVGAGAIVSTVHLPVLLAIPEVRVEWVTDANPGRNGYVHDAYDVRTIKLPASAFDLPAADVVLIAVPYGVRGPYYDALAAGHTAVYAEKPFSRSVVEHTSLCERFDQWRICCGFQYRSSDQIRFVQQVLADRLFGNLRHVEIGHGSPGNLQSTRYGSDLRLAGGGILFEVAVHILDALLFSTSTSDATVQSGRMLRHDGIDIHTEAALTLRTRDHGDVPASLVVSGMEHTIGGVKLYFDSAVLFFSRDGNISVTSLAGGRKYSLGSPSLRSESTPYQMVYTHWTNFLESIQQRRTNWTSASESLVTTKVIEQLYALPS